LNYGNNDVFDFRFSIADCKQRRHRGVAPSWVTLPLVHLVWSRTCSLPQSGAIS